LVDLLVATSRLRRIRPTVRKTLGTEMPASDMALGPLEDWWADLLPPALPKSVRKRLLMATSSGCRSHMIWRLIRSRISKGSRTVAQRGLAPASSASSRTPSLTPSRQPAPAASAKRTCVATGRDSANSIAPRISNTVV
jgi:hypothetical protein